MKFEFNPEKSIKNKEKHGIDFDEAQELWNDADRLVIPARTKDEPRFAILGEINTKIWIGIYTVRMNKTRIISVRRARKEERVLYES